MGGPKSGVGSSARGFANKNNKNNIDNKVGLNTTMHMKVPTELYDRLKDIAFHQHKPLKMVVVEILHNVVEQHKGVEPRPQWQIERERDLAKKRGGK